MDERTRRESIEKAKATRKLLGPRYPITDVPKVGQQRYARGGAPSKRTKLGPNHPTQDSPS